MTIYIFYPNVKGILVSGKRIKSFEYLRRLSASSGFVLSSNTVTYRSTQISKVFDNYHQISSGLMTNSLEFQMLKN